MLMDLVMTIMTDIHEVALAECHLRIIDIGRTQMYLMMYYLA